MAHLWNRSSHSLTNTRRNTWTPFSSSSSSSFFFFFFLFFLSFFSIRIPLFYFMYFGMFGFSSDLATEKCVSTLLSAFPSSLHWPLWSLCCYSYACIPSMANLLTWTYFKNTHNVKWVRPNRESAKTKRPFCSCYCSHKSCLAVCLPACLPVCLSLSISYFCFCLSVCLSVSFSHLCSRSGRQRSKELGINWKPKAIKDSLFKAATCSGIEQF